jgi:hypothetical protein
VHFTLYTDKTVAQCLTAINERMHVKESSTRPALDGWVEKSGAFQISIATPVIGRFIRKTALRGKIERENGVTVIEGSVPGGVSRNGQIVVFVALVLVVLTIIGGGNLLLGLLPLVLIPIFYIAMQGDYLNSTALLDEVQKALKAKPTPPKKGVAEMKSSATRSTSTRSPAKSTTTTRAPKPAARSTGSKSTAAPRSTTRAVPKPKPAAPKQAGFDMDEFPSTSIDGESVT